MRQPSPIWVHSATRRPGQRGCQVWQAAASDASMEPCSCSWPAVGSHYRQKPTKRKQLRPGQATLQPLPSLHA